MRIVLLVSIFILLGCDDREVLPMVDLCPDCTSSVTLNGVDWPSDPKLAWFQYRMPMDTFVQFQFYNIDKSKDDFFDILLFWKIPFDEGLYKFSTALLDSLNTDVELNVHEVEYGTPAQRYFPLYDESSSIEIISLNKETGAFVIEFDLHLYPNGNIGGPVHNSSYSDVIHLEGQASGTITEEQ